jgi:hypothetical protein
MYPLKEIDRDSTLTCFTGNYGTTVTVDDYNFPVSGTDVTAEQGSAGRKTRGED